MGRIRLTDGGQLSAVTGIDDYSRFVVCARVVARATALPVCEALELALARHGASRRRRCSQMWSGCPAARAVLHHRRRR